MFKKFEWFYAINVILPKPSTHDILDIFFLNSSLKKICIEDKENRVVCHGFRFLTKLQLLSKSI